MLLFYGVVEHIVKWQRFNSTTTQDANSEAGIKMADAMQAGFATVCAIVAAPVIAPALAEAAVASVSTELWLLKGAVSAGIQKGLRGKIDIPDLAGDAFLVPGASALLGASLDVSVKGEGFEVEIAGINKDMGQAAKEFGNSYLWGSAFGKLGNAIGETGSTAANVMINYISTTISTTGEQCVEKKLISPNGE